MNWMSKIEGNLVVGALTKAAVFCMSYFLVELEEDGENLGITRIRTKEGFRLDTPDLDRVPMAHKLGAFNFLQERECGAFVKVKKKADSSDPVEEKDELDELFDEAEDHPDEDEDSEDLASDLEKSQPPGD